MFDKKVGHLLRARDVRTLFIRAATSFAPPSASLSSQPPLSLRCLCLCAPSCSQSEAACVHSRTSRPPLPAPPSSAYLDGLWLPWCCSGAHRSSLLARRLHEKN